MKTLSISGDLALPLAYVGQRSALLGMSGSGKSNASVVLAEEMHAAGAPWIAIDPKGDWYGVRSSRDGKGPGLDVPVIGGEFGDLPLHVDAGARLGELAATGKLRGVIDTSGFESNADQSRFMAAFGRALLRNCKTPIHVFCDECDEYMPQPGGGGRLEGPAADCVHVWKLVARRGRSKGIGFTLASQRTALVNKTCLYQCENLIAMRMVGKHDKAAIEAWLSQIGDAKELLKSLPLLDDGEGWVWSPQRLKIMQRVKFRRRSTFDSGRTPEVGEAVVSPKLARVDIETLRREMAALAAEDEPDVAEELAHTRSLGAQELSEARARIRELESELRARPAFDEHAAAQMHANVGALADAAITSLEQTRTTINVVLTRYRQACEVGGRVIDAEFPEVTEPEPAPVVHRDPKPSKSNGHAPPATPSGLGKGEAAVLVAIAQHRDGVTREQLTVLTGYKRSSRDTYLQKLRAAKLTTEENFRIHVTDTGRKALGSSWKPLPTGARLREHWLGKLPTGERAVLEILVAAHPRWVSREKISEATGYKRSSRDTYIQKLRARRLATDAERGGVKASDELF